MHVVAKVVKVQIIDKVLAITSEQILASIQDSAKLGIQDIWRRCVSRISTHFQYVTWKHSTLAIR